MSDNVPSESSDIQPAILEHLVGQQKVISVLRTHLNAYWNDSAAGRNPKLSHLLFCGPAGTGKTEMANVLAKELFLPLVVVTADALSSSQSCCRTLMELEEGSILFIDEIHSLSRFAVAETILLKALAEGKVCLGGGRTGKPTIVELPRFCCIGATTDPWSLHPAYIQRCTVLHFDFYTMEELTEIARRRTQALAIQYEPGVLEELAKRAKDTPRIVLALLSGCHKMARSLNADIISLAHVAATMHQLGVDDIGLDQQEQRYLRILANAGGCLRLNVLAMRLGVPVRTITRMVEPFLVRQGLVCTSDRGRELTTKGTEYLKGTAQ